MLAIQATRFGGPEVLEAIEVPKPIVGPGQVLVDVVAAEILFLDTQLRSGWGKDFFPIEPPFTPGAGVVGRVNAVGDGVDAGLVGRQVIAETGGVGKYLGGGYARQAVAPVSGVHEIPAGLDIQHASAALHDGPTALAQLERAAVRPGERVLVNGAAGSLGNWFLPLLSAVGAVVIAAARGERKLAHARSLGAKLAVDYSEDAWTDRVLEATGGDGVDVVFDSAGGEAGRAAYGIMARGGRFMAYGAASGDFAGISPDGPDERGITVSGLFKPADDEWERLTEQALGYLAGKRVRPIIGQTFPLERAEDAHAAIEGRRTVGKTLLLP